MRHLSKKIWPYHIVSDAVNTEEIERWCIDKIGLKFKDWYGYCMDQRKHLYTFKDEESLLIFKLRWK